MKVQYLGGSPVDIDTHFYVEHGDVIEVPDELGERLLLAGWSFSESTIDDDGNPVPGEPLEAPEHPMWRKSTKKVTPDATEETAAAAENQEN